MTTTQKVIKYVATAFAVFLIVNIISAILFGVYAIGIALNLVNEDNNILEDMKVISNDIDNVSSIELELEFTNLEIKKGDTFKVETNNSKITVLNNNGTIVIEEESSSWISKRGNDLSKVIIYIPENMGYLDKINIENGAGEIKINALATNTLECEFGAGKVYIENLIVSNEANINGGAGKLEILSGSINDLDLDMGVGEVTLKSNITGNSDIDAGIGNLEIELLGDKDNYKLELNKGLGNIEVDNMVTSNNTVYGNGKNYIKIDGGIGTIDIKFEDVTK